MSLLPFGDLPRFRERQFVPGTIDLGDWSAIEPLFAELEKRAPAYTTAAELERWLLDQSELTSALDEEQARRYIAKSCHTDNADAEKAFLDFIENVKPQIKPWQFKLDQLYLQHPVRAQLPRDRYEVFDRTKQVEVELFRAENVPLETEDTKLGNEYQKLTGGLTVQFRGEEKTLVAMGRYQEEPDRALREEAWRAVVDRRLQERERFESLFDSMVDLRQRMAANAGFGSYVDYAFRKLGRFDYTSDDCLRFHDTIEAEVMPVLRELQSQRRAQLGVETLRPWDMAVDVFNRPPLKPFDGTAAMESGVQTIFDRLDAELGSEFSGMREKRLLDLANRKGKAPGGYQYTLSESRLPFIFMNAVGVQRDVETILHEAGHAFHAIASRGEDLSAYREPPIEFCEVASMSMELLGAKHLDVFYNPEDTRRARRVHLEGVLSVFPWIATVDAFQHWTYTHPGHGRQERTEAWMALMKRFGGEVDWSGLEDARANIWHRQLHIFLHAFYYVEYGIAQLGALQVWANARKDQAGALNAYKNGLRLGGSRPLPELFQAAGCRFEFGREAVAPLIHSVREELAQLN